MKNASFFSSLAEEEGIELEAYLRANIEVFAWTPYDMPGIDPEVTCHQLNVDRSAKPVIQRARRPTLMHVEAVEEEVDRLLEPRAIREVNYPTWLSNTVEEGMIIKEQGMLTSANNRHFSEAKKVTYAKKIKVQR